MTFFLVSSIVKLLVVFTGTMVGVALLTLAERRIAGGMQDRLGPNRVGPQGLLQPAADGLKNILKEPAMPAQADRVLFMLAPAVAFTPAMITFAVIPFAAPLPTPWGDVPMVVADLPVGFLYILAISSLGVYGMVLPAGHRTTRPARRPGNPRPAMRWRTLNPSIAWTTTIDPLYVPGGFGYILNARLRLEFCDWAQFTRSNQGSLEHANNIFQLNIKIASGKGILGRLFDGGDADG